MLKKYKKIRLETTRLFYKNLIYETENKNTNVYTLNLHNYEIIDGKLINYYKKENKKQIEFPCLKKYINEEKIKSTLFMIDKNIKIYFNSINNKLNIKLCISTDNLEIYKLHEILQLFT